MMKVVLSMKPGKEKTTLVDIGWYAVKGVCILVIAALIVGILYFIVLTQEDPDVGNQGIIGYAAPQAPSNNEEVMDMLAGFTGVEKEDSGRKKGEMS